MVLIIEGPCFLQGTDGLSLIIFALHESFNNVAQMSSYFTFSWKKLINI